MPAPTLGALPPLAVSLVQQAVRFVRIAIVAAPGLGQGHGPIGHALGYNPFEELEG